MDSYRVQFQPIPARISGTSPYVQTGISWEITRDKVIISFGAQTRDFARQTIVSVAITETAVCFHMDTKTVIYFGISDELMIMPELDSRVKIYHYPAAKYALVEMNYNDIDYVCFGESYLCRGKISYASESEFVIVQGQSHYVYDDTYTCYACCCGGEIMPILPPNRANFAELNVMPILPQME